MSASERRSVIEKACAEAGLPAALAGLVESLMSRDDDAWRICCGKGCVPCSTALGAAVDRARALLSAAPGA